MQVDRRQATCGSATRLCRRLVLLLIAAACFVGVPHAASAEEDANASWRREVERLWLEGRIDRIDESIPADGSHVQRYPLFLRQWWRDLPAVPGAVEQVVGDDISAQRIRWIQNGAVGPSGGTQPFPVAEDDPWPVLTAMVQERIRREALGLDPDRTRGLPLRELGAIRNEEALYALDQGLAKLDEAHGDVVFDHATKKDYAEAKELAERNRELALAALAGLILLSLALAWWGGTALRDDGDVESER